MILIIILHQSQEELEEHSKSHLESGDEDDSIKNLDFGFTVPEGQINNISQMLLKISSYYKDLKVKVESSDGKMKKHDIEMIK